MKEKLNKWTVKLSVLILALFILALIAFPVSGKPEFGVTNFESVWLQDSGGTAQPALRVNQRGAGMIIEALDNGTRVWGVTGGGKVTEGGVYCRRSSATITDTVSYTSTVTAISTPTWAGCTLSAITGDANVCGAAVGSGIITVTVKNSAATPAANSAGALVYYEVCGTPN
jgi:hypothetical protein